LSRGTRVRRAKRRARRAREAIKPTPQPELGEPTDWERVSARYRCLRGRAVTLSFVLFGPAVEARTPAELEAATAVEFARMLKDEPVN